MWWSPLPFIKFSLIKFIREFILVVGGGISYIRWEVLKITSVFIVTLWPWTNHWGNSSGMPLYCNFTCKSSTTLIDYNIFGNLVPSKLNGYIIQLSNYLNWKPACAIDSFKSWKVLITSCCWNVDSSSGKDLFLGRLLAVCCVGSEDGLLKRF